MSPGGGAGSLLFSLARFTGLGASPGALRRIVQIAPRLPLEEPLIPVTPCCARVRQGHVNPLMLLHAGIFLYTVSYVTMGFPTMHSLVQCQIKRTNNVLLMAPKHATCKAGKQNAFSSGGMDSLGWSCLFLPIFLTLPTPPLLWPQLFCKGLSAD